MSKSKGYKKFDDDVRAFCVEHYNIDDVNAIATMNDDELHALRMRVANDVLDLDSEQQSMKLLGNAMYGGTGNRSFAFFMPDVANDVTGEGRAVIKLMEHHLSTFWRESWYDLHELHDALGITLDESQRASFNGVEIVYGDTDSLYISYDALLHTIVGYDTMSDDERLDILIKISTMFLNEHNREYIASYYASRHAKSVHDFELETIARTGVWLDVKKRYAQRLVWKDGERFDHTKLKIIGLEAIKSSTPTFARHAIIELLKTLLTSNENGFDVQTIHALNRQSRALFEEFKHQPFENICANIKVSNYSKYVIRDDDELVFAPKTPANVKCLAYYNHLRKKYHLDGEEITSGKIKWYMSRDKVTNEERRFGFIAGERPAWADTYAPCDYEYMYRTMVLDPMNAIIKSLGMPELRLDGFLQFTLF